jgi:hypothetical protein
LWSTESLTSRLTSFFASKLTRGRVDTVAANERHPAFQHADFRGNLYKLVDMVLDVPSVIGKLADNCRGRIYTLDADSLTFERNADGSIAALQFLSAATAVRMTTQSVVFSAGEGNEALLKKIGSKAPAMQRRPLHQLLIKHSYPHPLYAHCTGSNPSPRLTISSHPLSDGKWVWYLGGDLATEGVALDAATLIAKGKQELRELLPWLDLGPAEWATLRIDRAEPKQKGLIKPDKAFAAIAENCANVIVAWPTKLTLAPNMADEVEALLSITPRAQPLPEVTQTLSIPAIAKPCWEILF